MKTQPGTRQATGPITSSSDLAYNPMGFQALEERQLLAADLYVSGLVSDDVATDFDFGHEVNTVAKDTNGENIGIAPGRRITASFLINNAGDELVRNARVAAIWDDDADLKNGYLRVLDTWIAAGELDATDDPTEPTTATTTRTLIIPPDEELNVDRFLHFVADPGNEVSEDDESNNISGSMATNNAIGFTVRADSSATSDLIGSQLDFTSDYDTAWAGGEIDLTYSIRNVGAYYSNGFVVRFYLSKINNTGNTGALNGTNAETISVAEDLLLGQQNWTSGLASEEEGQRTVTLELPEEGDDWWKTGSNNSGENGNYRVGFIIVQSDDFSDETSGLTGDGVQINNLNNGFGTFGQVNDVEDPSLGDTRFSLVFNSDVDDDSEDDVADTNGDSSITAADNIESLTFDTTTVYIWTIPELVADPNWDFVNEQVQLNAFTENIQLVTGDPTDLDIGGSYQIQFTVYNFSKIATGRFDVDFYLSRDSGIDIEEDILIGGTTITVDNTDLLTDETAFETFQISITLPNNASEFWEEGLDDYFIGAIINPPQELDPPSDFEIEEDLFNDNSNIGVNYDIMEVTVTNAGSGGSSTITGGDLTPLAFNVLPLTITPDKSFNLKFTYKNSGTAEIGATSVAYFYASTDSTIDPDEDTLIATKYIRGLKAGVGSRMVTVNIEEISSGSGIFANGNPGFVYIGLILDAENDVNEGNEANNVGTIANSGAELVRIRSANQILDLAPNKIAQARNLGTPSQTRYEEFSDFVGYSDKFDWYKMTITETSLLRLLLSGGRKTAKEALESGSKFHQMTGDADIFLKGPGGDLLTFKKNEGNRNEYIKWVVNPGTYWIQVRPGDAGDNSQYTLGVWAQPTGLTTAANRTGDFTFTVRSNSLSDLTT